MNIIKKKQDIKDYLRKASELCIKTDDFCTSSGVGTTTFKKVKGGEYEVFSYGSNWEDQSETIWDKEQVINYIWKNRKYINTTIKSGLFYSIQR